MPGRIAFRYGDFYDVPRMIDFQFRGEWFYLGSEFDEERDEYNDYYDVYLLPYSTEEEFRAHPRYWTELDTAVHLGRIAIPEVGLDPSLRKSIDADAFERWLSTHRER